MGPRTPIVLWSEEPDLPLFLSFLSLSQSDILGGRGDSALTAEVPLDNTRAVSHM